MAVTLILGQMVWADTTRAPQPGWGVAVDGDRVVAVASHTDLSARFPKAQRIDADGCVITPTFVNAHHHMCGVLAHGIPLDRAPAGFLPFLEGFWWPRAEDRLTHELIAAATDWACLEMVRSGVTTFYDCLAVCRSENTAPEFAAFFGKSGAQGLDLGLKSCSSGASVCSTVFSPTGC